MPRRKRAKEDHPKRALTAYMLFSQERRADIKKAHPDVGFGQIGKMLGEEWKKTSPEEKKRFHEEAAKDKIRYQKEMASYKEAHPESSDEEEKPAKKKRKKKDPNAPKKPCSAFFHFSRRMRPKIKEQNPQATFGQLGKLIGEEWAKLTPEQKKEYEEMAAADKERYAKENKAYQARKQQEEEEESSSSSESESSSESDSDSGDNSTSSSSSESEDSD
jgi:hypothetical protein